jgi:hypothetical protein
MAFCYCEKKKISWHVIAINCDKIEKIFKNICMQDLDLRPRGPIFHPILKDHLRYVPYKY